MTYEDEFRAQEVQMREGMESNQGVMDGVIAREVARQLDPGTIVTAHIAPPFRFVGTVEELMRRAVALGAPNASAEMIDLETCQALARWDDNGEYILGFAKDVELIIANPDYTFIADSTDLLWQIYRDYRQDPENFAYTALLEAVSYSMDDGTVLIGRRPKEGKDA